MNMSAAKTASNAREALALLDHLRLDDDTHVILGQTTSYRSSLALFTDSAEAMRDLRRQVGPMRKVENPSGFILQAKIGAVTVDIYPPAGTCRQVKVGKRVEQVAKEVRPAETVTVEETVDVYEWECGGVLVEDDAVAVPA